MSNTKFEKTISVKMIIVGSVNVGKTSLVTRYATGSFQEVTKSTSNASFITKTKIIDGIKYEIKLWDTAGQEKYRSLTKIFIKDAKIAILVYAIDDKNSFDDLKIWLDIIQETNSNNLILGVAANKADLYKSALVTDDQGKKYAQQINAVWRSTSSLLDDCGIDELVDILFNQYLNSDLKREFSTQGTIILDNKSEDKSGGCCQSSRRNSKKKVKVRNSSSSSKENIEKMAEKYNIEEEDF